MAKYDKYENQAGGFRARLAAALPLTNGGYFGAVSLNASGRVVPGDGGQTGLVGVLVKNVARGPLTGRFTSTTAGVPNPYAPIGAQAGDAVDIMTNGEVVDLDEDAFPAGSIVYAAADGTLSITAGGTEIGFTVEAGRLIVRFARAA